MTLHYVKSLENDQYEKLPGKTFVKGYIRSYARLVKLDVEDLLACYRQIADSEADTDGFAVRMHKVRARQDQNLGWLLCAAVLIMVVLGTAWWFRGQEFSAVLGRPPASIDTVQQNNTPTPAPPPQAVQNNNIQGAGQPLAVDNSITGGFGTPVLVSRFQGETETLEGVSPLSQAGAESVGSPLAESADGVGGPVALLDAGQAFGTSLDSEDEREGQDAEITSQGLEAEEVALPSADLDQSPGTAPAVNVSQRQDEATGLNARLIELRSHGQDQLRLRFNGASWVEVDNAENMRLYNDILNGGDELSIRGEAPFSVLLGNARVVREVIINARTVDISEFIRPDNTARLSLEP